VLGFNDRASAMDHFRLEQRSQRPDFAEGLKRSGIKSFAALLSHELLPLGVVHAADLQGPIHSLYHPRLSDVAGRAFFVGKEGAMPFTGFGNVASIGKQNSLLNRYASRFGGQLPDAERRLVVDETCKHHANLCPAMLAKWRSEDPESENLERLMILAKKNGIDRTMESLVQLYPAEGSADQTPIPFQTAQAASQQYVDYYHHAAAFDAEALLDVWGRCRVKPPSVEQCRAFMANRRGAQPLEDKSQRAEWLKECSSKLQVGLECQEGAESARAMLTDGKVDLKKH
jgi:hypothetical protein